jgi:dipeptidyl aminopeptidase/acylaminoacyl peptidase
VCQRLPVWKRSSSAAWRDREKATYSKRSRILCSEDVWGDYGKENEHGPVISLLPEEPSLPLELDRRLGRARSTSPCRHSGHLVTGSVRAGQCIVCPTSTAAVRAAATCRRRRGTARLTTAACLGLVISCGGPSHASAASPGLDGKIAFTALLDGVGDQPFNSEIFVMNADGSAPTRLTNNAASDAAPAWSPDGRRIAFESDSEIFVMNADGSAPTRLTNNAASDAAPAWSPDGQRIAFSSDRDGNSEIYVMNADGSALTRLTHNAASDGMPAWSPDGQRIAFDSDRDGIDLVLQRGIEIYVMNADGSAPTRLTNNAATDFAPAWSPDGQKIAFASTRDTHYQMVLLHG